MCDAHAGWGDLAGSGTCVCHIHMDEESLQSNGNMTGDRSGDSGRTSQKVKILVPLTYLMTSFHIVPNVDWI